MVNPVPGYKITTPYRAVSSSGSWKTCGWHTGVDYAAPSGTPVVAAIAGTIRHRNYGSSFGPYQFAISPSEGQPFAADEVFYAHTLDRLADGTEVQAGDVVAHVGNLGNTTGFHLHFEYHAGKQDWGCDVVRDPQPVIDHGGGGSTPPPSSSSHKYTLDIQSDMCGYDQPPDGYPDGYSLTIKELQYRLNMTPLVGGATIQETGSYWDQTDAEVRKWQEQIAHDQPDPPQQSYLGPKQLALMFPPPYVIHDNGLPPIASGPSTPPPVEEPPVEEPPPAPSLMYPEAIWEPITNFSGLRPFKGAAKKITLHTTETTVKPNWEAQQKGIPHFTIDMLNDRVWQHLALDVAAYTLSAGEVSPNSDSGQNIQIEIIGYAADSGEWSDAYYASLRRLTDWIRGSCGVPCAFPFEFGGNGEFTRRSWEEWYPASGIMGHQHCPYNDHWDPGDIDVTRLDPSMPPTTPPEEPSFWPEVPWGQYAKWLAYVLGTALGVALGLWLWSVLG